MNEIDPGEPTVTPGTLNPRRRLPWATWTMCAICIGVFLGIHSEPGIGEAETLMKWGWLPPDRIYDGSYWALVSSVFVHVDLWHLVFNLYWLYHLGRGIECHIGSWKWLVFFGGAGLVSSSAELAVGGGTGIGASGVGYALFGYAWILRKHVPSFAEILDHRTVVIFFLWLVGCVALSYSGLMAVGNTAHFSGLLLGMALGAWTLDRERRPVIFAAIALLVAASLVTIFWAPWSMSWTAWRGVNAHKSRNYADAIHWYEQSRRRGQDEKWCDDNIDLARQAMEYEKLHPPADRRQ